MTLRAGAIVEALGGDLHGDPGRLIARLAPLARAQPDELSFLADPKLTSLLAETQAGCVIVGPPLAEAARRRGDCIVAADPHLYFARVTQLWKRQHGGAARAGIHPSAVVEEGAVIDPSASVGALCFVGRGARIGADTVLMPRVTIGEGCVIGARCIVQSGAVIGGDGFGFAPRDGAW
jgi:UDP-3-O-[3-hydroxymyristoyl] glucosamine N-acyltransferase